MVAVTCTRPIALPCADSGHYGSNMTDHQGPVRLQLQFKTRLSRIGVSDASSSLDRDWPVTAALNDTILHGMEQI